MSNGKSCRFWSDNWSPLGSLTTLLVRDRASRLGIPLNASLASLSVQGNWVLPPARSEEQVLLQSFLTTLHLIEEEDHYEWELDGVGSNKFSTGDVYTRLRGDKPVVPWKKIVWIKGGISKHKFLTWLFVLNRCPTKDRIINWGLSTDPICLLCNNLPESRNHLYFECSFSWSLWLRVAARSMPSPPHRHWDATVEQLQNFSGGNLRKRLLLLSWQAVIYFIWSERNGRLHRNTFRTVDSITGLIDHLVRNRISSLREKNQTSASNLMQIWLATSA
ncbi:unnamed protein product [Thlaspi arvense]|uniref:Reverse transcriptase zinc-binding domain-containing protein n=1 Tax=Thlaspi arvense TaxID=13288 RepID=A0AAU9R8N4_THLAR|nr:unnamed protein product [Thlaspi arvense]